MVELRSFIVDQVGLFYSYVFYVAALIVATLITATKRTGGARIWLYVVLTLNLIAERLFLYYVDRELVHLYTAHEISDLVVVWSWRCRQTVMVIGGLILMWKICTYQDLHLLNIAILKEIQSQNADLKSQLEQLQSNSTTASSTRVQNLPQKDGDREEEVSTASTSLFRRSNSSTLRAEDDASDAQQHDSIFSRKGSSLFPRRDSTLDATFVPKRGEFSGDSFSGGDDDDDDDDDDETVSQGSSSGRSSRTEILTRSSTPYDPIFGNASSSSSFLGASFAAAGSSLASSASAMASSVGSTLSGLLEELRSLSPPGIKSSSAEGRRQPMDDDTYNLRPRRRSALFAASSSSSPSSLVGVALKRGVDVLQEETPEEFGAEVKRMWNVSRRNARKVKRVVNASSTAATSRMPIGQNKADFSGFGCFSSDDE